MPAPFIWSDLRTPRARRPDPIDRDSYGADTGRAMSAENVAVVRGLLAHGATRFALLLSLLAFGALAAVACDDDESATAESEVITSDFGQDPGAGSL